MSSVPDPEPLASAPIKVAEVSAGRGAAWMVEGFGIFRRQPLT
jgi:hypothetical protein